MIPKPSCQAVFVSVMLGLASPVAFAQTGGGGAGAGASLADPEGLIRQAADLRRDSRYAEALEVLHRASALAPGPRPTALTGLIEQALGRYGEACEHLTQALAVTDDPWVRRTRPSLEAALTDVRRRVGDLNVTGGESGASVVVNDVTRATLPLSRPIPVTAGTITLEVRARGFLTVTRSVVVTPGLMASERVNMAHAAPVSEDATTTPAVTCGPDMQLRDGLCYARPGTVTNPTATSFRWVGWIGLGVTAIASATAAGLGLSGNGTLNGYIGSCGGSLAPASCLGMYSQVSSELSGRATLVNTLWVVAGVGAVTSLVGFVLSVAMAHSDDTGTPGTLHLAALPGGLGVTW